MATESDALAIVHRVNRWDAMCAAHAATRRRLVEAEEQLRMAESQLAGSEWAFQAKLDDVAEVLGAEAMEAQDGYHGQAVRALAAERDRLRAERDAAMAALRLARPLLRPLENSHHYCRCCMAGTANGWRHEPFCRFLENERAVAAAHAACDAVIGELGR